MSKEKIIQEAKDFIHAAEYVDSAYVDCVNVDFFKNVLKLIENYEKERSAIIAGQETLQKHIVKTQKETWDNAINDFAEKLIKIGQTDGAYDYVSLWDVEKTKDSMLNKASNENSDTSNQEFIAEVNKNAALIEKAKEIINDYCAREFEDDEGADFSDFSKIGIAYTTTEDEKHEIQVNVNFVKCCIETLVDNKVIRSEQYSSLEDLVYNGLEGLDFDTLVSLEDDELEALCPNTSNRTDFTKMFLNVENLIPVEKE